MQSERDQDHLNPVIQSSQAEKLTPKYCTSIQVGLLASGHLVLSLLYSDPNQASVLLERVMIDIEHADNLANVLKSAVSEVQQRRSVTLNEASHV